MRRVWLLTVLAAAGSTVHAQCNSNASVTPFINSQTATPPGLQTDFPGAEGAPQHGAAVTAGTNAPYGIWMFINGSFNTAATNQVVWTSATLGPVTLTPLAVGASQILVAVPFGLIASQDTATVQVQQLIPGLPAVIACGATFTVNAVLGADALPNGTAGQSYAQPLASGGTAPYTVVYFGNGSVPGFGIYSTGLTQPNTNFTGTPTTPSQYQFQMTITDSWGNQIQPTYLFTVVSPPSITSLSQNVAPVGSCTLLTINGTNFLNGATAELLVGSSVVALPTTYVSATQLTAMLPQSATLAAGAFGIAVQGTAGPPNFGATSGSLPFTLLSPVITSIAPISGTAGAAAGIGLTVTGQNFVGNSVSCPATPSAVFFGSTPLSNVAFLNGGQLTATLPALPSTPGPVNVTVMNQGSSGNVSNARTFTVTPAPTVTAVTPVSCTASTSATAGCTTGAFPIQVTGTTFVTGDAVVWDTSSIGGTVASPGQINVSVPHNLLTVGTHQVGVLTADNATTNRVPFVVYAAPVLTGAQPSPLFTGSTTATLTLTGANFVSGMKVQWQGPTGSALLTPSSVTATQILVTVPGNLLVNTGNATVAVQSTDAIPVVSNSQNISLTVPRQPLTISTASSLGVGTVGVLYSMTFGATGGDQTSYMFSLAGGTTDGVTLSSDGLFQGTPVAPGTFTFTVQVTDNSGNTASKGFVLVVNPAPLTITTGPFGQVTLGTALNTTFAAKGGTPPYSFSSSGTLPPGTQFTGATLSGTVNAPGTFSFSVTVTDSAGATATQAYTISVTGTALSIATTSPLATGQVGVAYSAQFQAAGGVGPYTWTAGALPPGLTFSAGGVLSGTPTTAGSFTVGVRVTDSAKASASGSFAITINAITITTASLANGTVGSAYSGNLAASGGVGSLTWTASGLPAGITLSSAGAFGGTPTAAGTSQVGVTVTDSVGNTASRSYALTVNAAPLTISVAGTVPASVTVGSGVSLGFSVAGGSPPYTFSASGLPVGLTISATTGAISGAPTGAGTANVTVTVKDSAGVTAATSFNLAVVLPAPPPLTFTGVGSSVNPGSQSSVGVSVGSPYPVDITVKLTLTFSGTDPAVQFATGGTTATLTIPAGQTSSPTTVGVQTGTVAGTITITAQLLAGGQDITPTPAPTRTITVPSTAPVIVSVTAVRNSTGFTVTVTGYSSTLSLTTANFQFNGTNLGTTTLSIPVSSIFSPYFQSSAAQFGSNFVYTQPFTTSNPQAVTSVTVTLVNATGTSAGATANLQ